VTEGVMKLNEDNDEIVMAIYRNGNMADEDNENISITENFSSNVSVRVTNSPGRMEK